MRRNRLAVLVFVVAAVTVGCFDHACSVNGPTTLPAPSPSPSPSASPSPVADANCPEVYLVGVSVLGQPAFLTVGVEYVLDATPKDSDRQKVEPPSCHGKTVAWDLSASSALCALAGDTQGFNPRLKCTAPGRLVAKGCVSNPGGCGTVELEVRA